MCLINNNTQYQPISSSSNYINQFKLYDYIFLNISLKVIRYTYYKQTKICKYTNKLKDLSSYLFNNNYNKYCIGNYKNSNTVCNIQ